VASQWVDVWQARKWAFIGGDILMVIGVALLGVVFVGLLNLPPGAGEAPK
jgi:hypothetical protein